MDWAYLSAASHGWLIGLGSGELGGWVNNLHLSASWALFMADCVALGVLICFSCSQHYISSAGCAALGSEYIYISVIGRCP